MKICAVRLSVVPTVAHLRGDLRVARFAKNHQIELRMRPSLGERKFVMDFLCRSHASDFQALLTEKIRRHITVAEAFPRFTIATAHSRVAIILLAAFVFQPGMFFTVPSVGQPGTAGVRAGTFRFPWHHHTIFRAKKALQERSPTRLSYVLLCPS